METYHLLALMIMPLILVAVIFYSPMTIPIKDATFFKPSTAVAADPPSTPKEICQKTVLYIYTQPVQKEKTVLCHPNRRKRN